MNRKQLIAQRVEGWERDTGEMLVKSTCLKHCYRGGVFSGVLWSVWERTFTKDVGPPSSESHLEDQRRCRAWLAGHAIDVPVEIGPPDALRALDELRHIRDCAERSQENRWGVTNVGTAVMAQSGRCPSRHCE